MYLYDKSMKSSDIFNQCNKTQLNIYVVNKWQEAKW